MILLLCATGLLSVNSALDFELCREYYLSVEGARGKPSLSDIATVIINITDVNDNTPVFNRSSYSAVIAEDISPGDMALQVSRFLLPVTQHQSRFTQFSLKLTINYDLCLITAYW